MLQKPKVFEAFFVGGRILDFNPGLIWQEKSKLRPICSLNNFSQKIMNRKYIYPVIILIVAALLLVADRCA